MIVKNINVFTDAKKFVPGAVRIKDGLFEAVYTGEPEAVEEPEEIVDGQGCYAIPGMIDIHFHGCKGADFCDGTTEALKTIAGYEVSQGVTSIVPASMTLPSEQLEDIVACAADFRNRQQQGEFADQAELIGINMEGPFISKVKKGAQDAENIIPCDLDMFHRFQEKAGGLVKFIGVAAEEEGAMPFIEAVKDSATAALAHTCADYDTAMEAFKRGAGHVVHLFNAMPGFSHREPGLIGALADSPGVTAELICDGVHVHPAAVRAAYKMLGAERIILISDSMRATGMPDGNYTLGGLGVQVSGNRAVLTEGGALAGSVTTLPDCFRYAVREVGIPLETAVAAVTENPARSIGEYDKYGSITPGKVGDLVLLDEELELKCVIKKGRMI